jgi:DNA polymerase-1
MALAGDPSDNVPGVPGVGPKTAASLIGQFGSIENLYENLDDVKNESLRKRLAEHRDLVDLSRRLVTIDDEVTIDLNLEDCRSDRVDRRAADEFFRALGFRSLLEEETGSKPAERTPVARQAGLFPAETQSAVEGEPESIKSLKKDYRTLRTLTEVRDLAGELRRRAPFSIDLETTSLEPHEARIVGIAVSWRPHQATRMPLRP